MAGCRVAKIAAVNAGSANNRLIVSGERFLELAFGAFGVEVTAIRVALTCDDFGI